MGRISCFFEILTRKPIFRHGKRINQFCFSFIGHVTKYYVTQRFQSHDTSARVGFTACKAYRLAEVLFDDVFGKMLCAKERCIHLYYVFNGCIRLSYWSTMPLIERGRRVIMYLYKVPGNIVPTYVEMIDY